MSETPIYHGCISDKEEELQSQTSIRNEIVFEEGKAAYTNITPLALVFKRGCM